MKAEGTVGTAQLPVRYGLLKLLRMLEGPIIAILGAILIGAVLILLTGQNPLSAYWAMLTGAFAGKGLTNLASTLNRAIPIVGMGLAAAISFKAGFFNIGGEGQMVLGGVVTALVAIYLHLPAPVLMPVILLCAILTGGLYAALAAFLEFQFSVPLLISTLILNYPADYLASYLVTTPFRDVPSGMNESLMVPQGVRLSILVPNSQLNSGIFIILALIGIAAFVIYRTVPGYNLRMAGLNRRFAIYGGVNTKKLGYWSMFASGAVAGLVGALLVLGVLYRYIDGAMTSPLYAWVGVMAALLSGSDPFGVMIAGFVFSAIQTGGYGMERDTNIPRELSLVLQALIIMFIAVRANFHISRKADEHTP
ncbi:MAG: ABC transporter permease [Anaerolineaceae bacterium]|nr:ABC transporter permease [Anaerolineaceae bacterium]